jgi:hypothetical protein
MKAASRVLLQAFLILFASFLSPSYAISSVTAFPTVVSVNNIGAAAPAYPNITIATITLSGINGVGTYTWITAGCGVIDNVTWIRPIATPPLTGCYQLVGFAAPASLFPPSGGAGGDLGGTYPSPTVVGVSHVTSGVLPAANGGAGTITGALKGNGSGTVSQAACADLSNGATGCSTTVGTAATVNTGTSGATIPLLNGTNTWSGVQTFTNSDIALLGSSTGSTTFTSDNAAITNYVIHIPAIASTLVTRGDTNTVPLGAIAQIAANTMLGNWTASTANVAAQVMPSCSDTTGNHLNYVSGTGITCGTSLSSSAVTLTGTSQAFSGGFAITDFSIGTKSSGTYQVNCGNGPQQWLTNGGAFTLSAPAGGGNCLVKTENNGSAGVITPSGFSPATCAGATADTVNGHKFLYSIITIHGDTTCSILAYQ